VRFTRWDDRVPAAAWLVLALTLVQRIVASTSHELGLAGIPLFILATAVGIVLGNRACWIAAFTLSGVVLTILLIGLGSTAFGLSRGWDGAITGILILQGAQFASLVALRKYFVPSLAR
jgi:hypothetical protein